MNYPVTRTSKASTTYFNHTIKDPYRWLEDDRAEETKAWVKAQNKCTFDYLAKIPFRDALKDRLTQLADYEKYSAPFIKGDYTYYYKNDGLQNHSVLYRQRKDAAPEVFLDPNTFSDDGTTALTDIAFSKDNSLAAYAISEGGSDWRNVFIIDVATKAILEEPLVDIKFSGLSWRQNEGFYYASYDKPDGSELSAKTDHHKLYFHFLGTSQKEDPIIFGATPEERRRYVFAKLSEDHRFLVVSGANATSGNDLFIQDLAQNNSRLRPVLTHFNSDTALLCSSGSTLYFETNLQAPNRKIITVDAAKPQPENWRDFIPETQHVLHASTGAGYIFASYMIDALTAVKQYAMHGEKIRDINLPGLGTATGFSGKLEATTLYYSFTNYLMPATLYALNPTTGKSTVYKKPELDFDPDKYVSTQVFYASKDGTKIPLIISHKKGLKRNGKNPTLLYGYGGFNISLTPGFSISTAAWLEQGGVYAVANLRGGGEYGKAWHEAGIQCNKQNVFDDFIAAAEYLIDQKYTSPAYLAIRGGSNGGLLVGATMTQRPDLMRVALPEVGVLDMLRYHTFTAGAGWAYDYGTAEDSTAMFEYLKGYSPVHNLHKGTHYPATLISTGDHDDRVVPAHSFKFAATLQACQAGEAPTLIRIETNAGHGAGTPINKQLAQLADVLTFCFSQMKLSPTW